MPRTHIDTLTLWRQLRHHLSTQRPVWTRWTTHPAPECHGWRPWPNNFCLPGRKTRFGQRVSFWFTGRTNLTYKKITLEVRRFTRGKDCIFSADFTLHHKNIKQVFAFIDDPRDACPWLAMKRRASFSNEQKKKQLCWVKKICFILKQQKHDIKAATDWGMRQGGNALNNLICIVNLNDVRVNPINDTQSSW